MVDPVPDAANIGRDRGDAAGSGLDQDRRPPLLVTVAGDNRRQTEDISGGDVRAQSCVIARRKKAYPVAEVEFPGMEESEAFAPPP